MISVHLATGFSPGRDQPSGLDGIADDIRVALPDARVQRHTWRDSIRGDVGSPLAIVSHSYGWEFLARLCRQHPEVRVDLALCIDPVPRVAGNALQALAGLILRRPIGTLRLPPNVDRCIYWRQVQGAPYGRPLQAAKSWHALDLRGVLSVTGTVYARESRRTRLRRWEHGQIMAKPPGHDEIDSWPAIRHAIVEEITALAATRTGP